MDRAELVDRRLREALADGPVTIEEARLLLDRSFHPTLDTVLSSGAFVVDGDTIRAAS